MGELLTGSLMQYSVSESRKTWDAVNTCNHKVLRDLKERLIVVFIVGRIWWTVETSSSSCYKQALNIPSLQYATFQ